MLSDLMRAIGQRVWHTAAIIRTTNRNFYMVPLIVIAAAALSVSLLGRPASKSEQLRPPEKIKGEALSIIVPSKIYVEPTQSWPMLVGIDPSQQPPPDSVFHIYGLPPAS